jgi:hypothetical protein
MSILQDLAVTLTLEDPSNRHVQDQVTIACPHRHFQSPYMQNYYQTLFSEYVRILQKHVRLDEYFNK